jgi:hypothetical protein
MRRLIHQMPDEMHRKLMARAALEAAPSVDAQAGRRLKRL